LQSPCHDSAEIFKSLDDNTLKGGEPPNDSGDLFRARD
jgi:hypothetical protein